MSLYDASLLVYHVAHEDGPPFMKRAIEDGLPSLPITCDLCERPISKREELSYDFLFTRLESVEILD
jgi:hypothetical protein